MRCDLAGCLTGNFTSHIAADSPVNWSRQHRNWSSVLSSH